MSTRFALLSAVFELQNTLWQVHPKKIKMPLNIVGAKGTPYNCYYCRWIPKFNPVHSTDSRFGVTGHFETSAPNVPPNDLEHHDPKGTPYMFYYNYRIPNSNPFCSTANRFRVTGHFETSDPNDPKMALDTTI